MTARKLNAKYFLDLLKYLREFSPESLMVCNMVKTLIQHPSVGFDVWVERWPTPTTVVVNANKNTCLFDCWKPYVIAFSSDHDVLIQVISDVRRPDLVNKRSILLPGLSPMMVKSIKAAFPRSTFRCREFQMLWLKSPSKSEDSFKIPSSNLHNTFRHGNMTREVSELLVRHLDGDWAPFNNAKSIYATTNQLEYPNVVIFNEYNVPIGWTLKHFPTGFLSHLHIHQEYRNKGIGKYIVSSLCGLMLQEDAVAFAQISYYNLVSIKILKELGFQNVGTVTHCIMIPK